MIVPLTKILATRPIIPLSTHKTMHLKTGVSGPTNIVPNGDTFKTVLPSLQINSLSSLEQLIFPTFQSSVLNRSTSRLPRLSKILTNTVVSISLTQDWHISMANKMFGVRLLLTLRLSILPHIIAPQPLTNLSS